MPPTTIRSVALWAPYRHTHRHQREQTKEGKDAPGREQRAGNVFRTHRHPQAVVGNRRGQHPGKHQEVGGGEHRPQAFGRALLLEIGLQRHVEHAGAESQHGQPDERGQEPSGQRSLTTEDVGRRESQGQRGDGHHEGSKWHEAEIDLGAHINAPLGEAASNEAACTDPADQRDQQRHDLCLRGGPALKRELIDIQLGHSGQRPEEDDACSSTGDFSHLDEATDVGPCGDEGVSRKGGLRIGRPQPREPERGKPAEGGHANQGRGGRSDVTPGKVCQPGWQGPLWIGLWGEPRDVGQPVARRHANECGGQRDHCEDAIGRGKPGRGNGLWNRAQETRV